MGARDVEVVGQDIASPSVFLIAETALTLARQGLDKTVHGFANVVDREDISSWPHD